MYGNRSRCDISAIKPSLAQSTKTNRLISAVALEWWGSIWNSRHWMDLTKQTQLKIWSSTRFRRFFIEIRFEESFATLQLNLTFIVTIFILWLAYHRFYLLSLIRLSNLLYHAALKKKRYANSHSYILF